MAIAHGGRNPRRTVKLWLSPRVRPPGNVALYLKGRLRNWAKICRRCSASRSSSGGLVTSRLGTKRCQASTPTLSASFCTSRSPGVRSPESQRAMVFCGKPSPPADALGLPPFLSTKAWRLARNASTAEIGFCIEVLGSLGRFIGPGCSTSNSEGRHQCRRGAHALEDVEAMADVGPGRLTRCGHGSSSFFWPLLT